jgi:hypothetical protein|tara:strand:- start:224 stop:487 length:264 start_codon:yes stop_codon:yes gene_type:complete
MNQKGQTIILKFMIAITIIIVVLAVVPLMSEINLETRETSNMDCDNSSISDFDKLGCLSADASLFLITAVGLFVALAVFGIRRLSLK